MAPRPLATITFYNERCQIASASDVGDASSSKRGASRGGSLIPLPLLERRPGASRATLRYACVDGKLRVMRLNEYDDAERGNGGQRMDKALRDAARRCVERAQHALLPEPSSVTNDYWEYAKFRFAQRIAKLYFGVRDAANAHGGRIGGESHAAGGGGGELGIEGWFRTFGETLGGGKLWENVR